MEKELWTATYVEIDFSTMTVISFGNLNSAVYDNKESAWEAIMKDVENYRENGKTSIDKDRNRVEVTFADGMLVEWELQNMHLA